MVFISHYTIIVIVICWYDTALLRLMTRWLYYNIIYNEYNVSDSVRACKQYTLYLINIIHYNEKY